jgi:hypothetical protein
MTSSGELPCRYWFFAALRRVGRRPARVSTLSAPIEEALEGAGFQGQRFHGRGQ